MRGLLNNPTLALESVQFQNQNFFKDLTAVYAELQKLPEHEVVGSDLRAELGRTVKRHTGLPVSFDLAPTWGAWVGVPMVDRNHPFLRSGDREHVTGDEGTLMVDRLQGKARGSVNLKTGRVSGIYESFEAVVHISKDWVVGDFSPEELAALSLHEVGHLFTYLEYLTRQISTNQVLAGVAKRLDGTDSVHEREAVIVLAKNELHLQHLDAAELATSKPEVIEAVILKSAADQAVHELGSNIYDYSTWEYLADQYAARYGAARHVITALSKVHRNFNDIAFRSTPEYLYMEAMKLVWVGFALGGGAFVGAATSTVAGPVVGRAIGAVVTKFLMTVPLMMIAMDSRGDGTYDTPEARFRRLRNQVVEALKDKRMDKPTFERLAADLKVIDEILEEVHDRRQLLGVLRDAVVTATTGNPQQRQKKLQQQLEALAANDLFVKAQEFRHLKPA